MSGGTITQPMSTSAPAAPTVTPQDHLRRRMPITCGGCDTIWYRLGWEHCCARNCHQTFASTRAGDKHRVGAGKAERCLSVAEMVALRWDNGKLVFEYTVEDNEVAWRMR